MHESRTYSRSVLITWFVFSLHFVLPAHGQAGPGDQASATQFVQRQIQAATYAFDRFTSVLRLSEAQRHSIDTVHTRLMDAYRENADQVCAAFERKREELEKMLADDPLFAIAASSEEYQRLSRAEKWRHRAYRLTSESGQIAPAAYGGDLRDAYDEAHATLVAGVAGALDTVLRELDHAVTPILTEVQLSQLPSAWHAHQVGMHMARNQTARLGSTYAASVIDVRLLLDPHRPVISGLPASVTAFRTMLAERMPDVVRRNTAIEDIVCRYEQQFADESDDDLDAEDRASLRLRRVNRTAALQDAVENILLPLDPDAADTWRSATNRLVYQTLFSRWQRIDATFDAAIIDAAAGDEEYLAALHALKAQYESECIAIERRLISGSRAVVAQDTRDWPSRQEQMQAYMEAFEEPLREALQRNTWYQQQIDTLSFSHTGVIR